MFSRLQQYTRVYQELKTSAVFCLLLFCTLVESCNTGTSSNGGSTNSDSPSTVQMFADTTKRHAAVEGVGFTIHNLYIPKADFLKFYSHDNGIKALDLEFYFPKDAPDGSPTLGVWTTKGNHQFEPTDTPTIMHYAGISFIELPENVFLGGNELVPRKSLVDSITKGDGCPDACVLYFVPQPQEHLSYKIYLIADSTKITSAQKNITDYLTSLTITATTNPSPPRSATQ